MKATPDAGRWPFDQPRNCAAMTMRQILDGSEPILLVSHDADDHGWQFIGSTDANTEDGRLVCLEHMVTRDPSVLPEMTMNSKDAATPNHALQRTAPCVTAPASTAAFPPTAQVPRRTPLSLSLGSLGVTPHVSREREPEKTFRVR